MLAAIAPDLDLSTEAFPFMTFRRVDLGMMPVLLARINYAGDLGYELWVTPEYQRELFDRIVAAGEPHGLRLFGMRALMSLRLEKSYGTWFREYRPIYTPLEGGITRYIRLDHEFIGRAAHEAEVARGGPDRRLVTFVVEPDPDDPADVIGDEPVWHDGEVVGWITSGGYGHHVKASIALGLRAGRAGVAGRPGRRRVRDRDHRPPPAGAAPARAAVRPPGRADAPVTEAPGGEPGRPVHRGRPGDRGRAGRLARGRRSSAPARTRDAAGRCAWPATAANCLATVEASPTSGPARRPARAGAVVERHRATGTRRSPCTHARARRRTCRSSGRVDGDVVVIGGGSRGPRAAASRPTAGRPGPRRGRRQGGRRHLPGPTVVARTPRGMLHVEAEEIVVATGAAEIQPVCPGNDLTGILTARAAERLRAAGVDLAGPRRDRRDRQPAGPVRGRRRRPRSARS